MKRCQLAFFERTPFIGIILYANHPRFYYEIGHEAFFRTENGARHGHWKIYEFYYRGKLTFENKDGVTKGKVTGNGDATSLGCLVRSDRISHDSLRGLAIGYLVVQALNERHKILILDSLQSGEAGMRLNSVQQHRSFLFVIWLTVRVSVWILSSFFRKIGFEED